MQTVSFLKKLSHFCPQTGSIDETAVSDGFPMRKKRPRGRKTLQSCLLLEIVEMQSFPFIGMKSLTL